MKEEGKKGKEIGWKEKDNVKDWKEGEQKLKQKERHLEDKRMRREGLNRKKWDFAAGEVKMAVKE